MWMVTTSICSFLVFVTATMLCLCWRKKTQKNDLLGLDGLVTQKNPDENVNHLPSADAQAIPDGIKKKPTGDAASDANKSRQSVVVNNPRRSLPDIPSDGIRNDGDVVTYEPNGDNSSDLYATVEPYQNSSKRHTLPNGINSRPSVSQHSSISQADDNFSPYARVKEHPYDKLKTEHPYARVQPSSSQEQDENSSSEATPRTATLRNDRLSTTQPSCESAAPPRSRRSSVQSNTGLDIPAASAVAGGIAANQELPYMTPPIVQPNFSGDSQDSSKGYTSISVREPLANIRAQTKVLNKVQGDLDPHYSTVSDDSDDMYTTIQDPNNAIYTSGSETYAQIQPPQVLVAAEINQSVVPTEVSNRNSEVVTQPTTHVRAPQPPSVDSLKHVTHTHSRQASSSSSVGNLGSPKPEKRQANSPLPPPPPPSQMAPSPDRLSIDKLSIKNLDDMYAKVHKNKKKNDKDEPNTSRISVSKESDLMLQRKSTSSSGSEEPKPIEEPSVDFNEHDYETLRKSSRRGSDPGYEKLKPRESECGSEPGYDTINGPDSILSSDPGYEVLKHGSKAPSEIDPNYEELRHRACSIGNNNAGFALHNSVGSRLAVHSISENDGYSVVNKPKHNSSPDEIKSKSSSSYESDPRDYSTDEPNYESMPSESLSEHNYAMLKSTESESDPNYESVNHSDPNYESVKYLDVSLEEPPYERLHNEDSSRSDSNPSHCKNSENVLSETEAGYEKVQMEVAGSQVQSGCDDSEKNVDPGYETIKNEKLNSTSLDVNVQLENDYDGIVQV